jgi:hypothetical protein
MDKNDHGVSIDARRVSRLLAALSGFASVAE